MVDLLEWTFWNTVLVIAGVLVGALVVIVITGLVNIHLLPRFLRRAIIAVRLFDELAYPWRSAWRRAKHLTEEYCNDERRS
jgi:hypothetical protein